MTLLEIKPSAKKYERASVTAAQLSDLSVADEYTRVRAWLDGKVAEAQDSPKAEMVTLTPVLAEVLLNRNHENRPLSSALIDALVRDINADAYVFNGEPIIISRDGSLNDGQHRCTAVAKSGKPIKTMVVFGVSRESRTTVDQGKLRTVGDYLGMDGLEEGLVLAALANMYLFYSQTGCVRPWYGLGKGRRYRPTKSEILQAARDNPDFLRAIKSLPSKNVKVFGGRTALAFLTLVIARRANWADAVAFVDTLVNGANLPKNSPILYVRSRFVVDGGRLKVAERMELMFRAWNAHRLGQTPSKMQIMGGKLPILER
jgi:hypothetical protein